MRSAPLLEIAGAAVRDHLSLLRSANARAVAVHVSQSRPAVSSPQRLSRSGGRATTQRLTSRLADAGVVVGRARGSYGQRGSARADHDDLSMHVDACLSGDLSMRA